ncbi:MAG: helix-turn-helix domain-containing protein, partial [Mucilaginibacter sp.]
MANLTISMSKIRKILKMYSQQRPLMTIAAQADASRNTVKKYVATFKASGLTFDEVNALNDKELEDLFGKSKEHPPNAR